MLRAMVVLAPFLSVSIAPSFKKQSLTLTIFPLSLAHNPHMSASSAANHLRVFTTPDRCHARLFARLLAPKESVLAISSAFSRASKGRIFCTAAVSSRKLVPDGCVSLPPSTVGCLAEKEAASPERHGKVFRSYIATTPESLPSSTPPLFANSCVESTSPLKFTASKRRPTHR